LGLGPFYLEAIAIDPKAGALDYPRWFAMDDFTGDARITNWICATTDFQHTQTASALNFGDPVALSRGDLRWTMLVPQDGRLPFDGACPAVIDWGDTPHPAGRLGDVGARLRRLTVAHPKADDLRAQLSPLLDAECVRIEHGPTCAFEAEIALPHGNRVLQ